MTNEELDNYMKTVNPNFDSHIEKGTIEMSNEYYNLLEEKMARLINENQELRDKISDMQESYETDAEAKFYDCLGKHENELEKETQELKKQLENNSKINVADHKYASECEDKVIVLETQQKEFIKYLEDEIEECFRSGDCRELKTFQNILQKYKEIVGVSDEKEN